jgi:hypothetical protein
MRRLLIALVPAAAIAAGNYFLVVSSPGSIPDARLTAWFVAAPLLLAVFLAMTLPGAAVPAPAATAPESPPRDTSADGALRLLAILQEGGRLVDFLEEDIGAYSDEQIGAAARGIHEGCRKALRDRVALEPVLAGAEGESVVVEPGFDPAAVRLTGNVAGAPPFRGVLRHPGWRARGATLPARGGQDPHVVAPAEVEIA